VAQLTLPSALRGLADQLGTAVPGAVAGVAERLVAAVPGTEAFGGAVEQVARAVPGAGPLATVGTQLKRPERIIRAARLLVGAGVIRPERPDQAIRAAQAFLSYRMTPAAGFVVAAIRYPDEPAISDELGNLTFAQVDRRTNALARALADAGIGQDDGVAIMCRDHRWFIETTVALSKLGATALYYNTQFAGPQLRELTEREDPAAIVHDEEFAEVVGEAAGGRPRWVAWHDGDDAGATTLEELIQGGDESDLPAPDKIGNIVLLTSGSTGTPKGASRGQPDAIDPIVALLSRIPLRAREPTVFAAPLFHAWGFAHFNLGLLLSSTYFLRRRFDPEATLAAIQEESATVLVIVPVMMQRILELDEEKRRQYDLSSLRVVAASGGALSGDLAQRWMDEFGDNLYNLYGSTEVAWATIAAPGDLRATPGTTGPPPPGTSIRILDDEKDELPAGETGEIYVGNEMLLEGYTSGESEEIVDGHMSTGDLGHLDEEGRLFIEGRADNMIVSGGENVYPEEVEETLEKHDRVSEAAVIGVEDEDFGERLKAFVVTEGEISEDDLKSHVKGNLANYKVPREIEFLDELPRKPQGKVDKQRLAEEHEEDGSNGGDSSAGSGEGDSGDGDSGGGDS
jgi:acyl-CoA synthetase (AMP-forming)/AMP-acid ligase II